MHRGLKYAGMRAASNVLLRDVNTSLIIEEMYRGTNVIYADFTDYDELAHHCGPERVESFEALDGVDRRDRDAGQGDRRGAPAVQVHRPVRPRPEPRRDLPAALRRQPRRVRPRADGRPRHARPDQDQGRGLDLRQLAAVRDHPEQGRRPERRARRPGEQDRRRRRRQPRRRRGRSRPSRRCRRTIAVVGSGNLGLVWFTGHDHRLTVEELEELHPGLVAVGRGASRASGCCWSARRSSGRSSSARRAPASSTRTRSRARTRRRCSGRTRS